MRDSNNRNFMNVWMTKHNAFDFNRGDVLAATNNDVFQTIPNLSIAIWMNHSCIPTVKPPVAHGFFSCLRIVEVPLHHDIPAHNYFTKCFAVMRHLVPILAHYPEFTRRQEFDSLARFD